MTDRVHGGVVGGEFLTGKMDFFAIETDLPMAATGVNTPAKDLYQISDAVWTPVTVNGVTYNSRALYNAAFIAQQNLNILMGVFAQRANPVIISISDSGAVFNNIVNIATEKTGLWYAAGEGNYDIAADETNYLGYVLSVALGATDVKFWAIGDNPETATPAANMVFGGPGANSSVARRIAL